MDIQKSEAEVLFRALRCHDRRMQEIANSESQSGRNDQAMIAFDEARLARDMLDSLNGGGSWDLSYSKGQLLMRALRSYSMHVIRENDGAALVGRRTLGEQIERDNEYNAVNRWLARLEQEGVRIQ